MLNKRYDSNTNCIMVTFTIPGSVWVDRINLVGDFNEWDPHSLPFYCNHDGDWQITITLKPDQTYRFRYLFDDAYWCSEPQSDDFIANNFGSYDGVVKTAIPSIEFE